MRLIDDLEEGLLKPEKPLTLTPRKPVAQMSVSHPDPKRWDIQRLVGGGAEEDQVHAEQGLAEWVAELDER